ncbi:retinol dehydrogenase 8-like [Lytechinus pictus]|uniref:retinol dehydrogenase 8-like n=1 Tax=Lytechinus pictus TaxID=7653 RepID=UPI0030BA2880
MATKTGPRVAIITGCSSGIGLSAAVTLAKDPAKGYIVYATMRNVAKKDNLEKAAGATLNKTLFIIPLDVTKQDSIDNAVKVVFDKHKRIDILVNNAGHGSSGYVELVSEQQMRQLFDTNFFGPVNLMKAVLPIMKKQRSGRIMNVSSVAGITAWPFGEIYAASKYALEGFTESLSIGYRAFGIWVNSIQPGPVRTDFIANMGSANNQPEFLKLAEEKNIDKESREICQKVIQLLVANPNFEKENQTPEEIANVIKESLESKKPHLRNPTSQLRYDYAKKYFVDPYGDEFCETIVPHIIPDSLKK